MNSGKDKSSGNLGIWRYTWRNVVCKFPQGCMFKAQKVNKLCVGTQPRQRTLLSEQQRGQGRPAIKWALHSQQQNDHHQSLPQLWGKEKKIRVWQNNQCTQVIKLCTKLLSSCKQSLSMSNARSLGNSSQKYEHLLGADDCTPTDDFLFSNFCKSDNI